MYILTYMHIYKSMKSKPSLMDSYALHMQGTEFDTQHHIIIQSITRYSYEGL